MKKLFMLLLVALGGCASVSDRISDYPLRHPCGNIWNVCAGDSYWVDRIRAILEGQQG